MYVKEDVHICKKIKEKGGGGEVEDIHKGYNHIQVSFKTLKWNQHWVMTLCIIEFIIQKCRNIFLIGK